MSEKIEIPAIHDNDLRHILEKFGLAEKIDNEELRCSLCGNIITWNSIAALKVNGDNLDVFCNYPDCLQIASNK